MKIIEFLMDNIFIAVIIFGALASLFGKSSSKKKPSQMPDFGGGGLPRNLFPQSNDPEPSIDPSVGTTGNRGQTIYHVSNEEERQTSASRVYDHERNHVSPLIAETAVRERVVQKARVNRPSTQDVLERSSAAQGTRITSVRSEDMRRAVVWAEVLGPPRSKKPFGK